jgi:hypothetical protein
MIEYRFENSHHILLVCARARDLMIHIYRDDDASRMEIEICRREESGANGTLSFGQRKTVRNLVNHIIFCLWSQLTSPA